MKTTIEFIDNLSVVGITTIFILTYLLIYLILITAKERKEYLKVKQFYEVQKRIHKQNYGK